MQGKVTIAACRHWLGVRVVVVSWGRRRRRGTLPSFLYGLVQVPLRNIPLNLPFTFMRYLFERDK